MIGPLHLDTYGGLSTGSESVHLVAWGYTHDFEVVDCHLMLPFRSLLT
jgi:hypothetical protein